jgi:predicted nucleic acid-binding protein
MVLAAGLTSRREPASFSRRLVELAFEGNFELVLTEVLLEEVHAVLVDSKFIGRVSEPEATLFVEGLATTAAILIRDGQVEYEALTDDPDDDYLAHAALQTHAYLVTRDAAANFGKVEGLESGRPGSALRLIGAFDEDEGS